MLGDWVHSRQLTHNSEKISLHVRNIRFPLTAKKKKIPISLNTNLRLKEIRKIILHSITITQIVVILYLSKQI